MALGRLRYIVASIFFKTVLLAVTLPDRSIILIVSELLIGRFVACVLIRRGSDEEAQEF